MTKLSITPVILCGGSGSRLWPLSRESFPKQFYNIHGSGTLFQQTINRLKNFQSNLFSLNDPIVVCNEEHRFLVLDQIKQSISGKIDLILEPEAKNTAPALTLAALQALSKNIDPVLIVMPADQVIQETLKFYDVIERCINLANKNYICTLGLKPNRPDTGFGYIKQKGSAGKYLEFDIDEFHEKPNIQTAKKYLKDGNYLWNSGIFVTKASVWLSALAKFRVDILENTKKSFNMRSFDNDFIRPNKEIFKRVHNGSIDYVVMEKAPEILEIKVLPFDSGWDDLGSWEAIWELKTKDSQNNVSIGDCINYKTINSLTFSNSRLLVTCGIKDMIVIETADAVFVSNKNQSKDLKLIVNELKLKNRKEMNFHRKVLRPWGWFDVLDEGNGFKVKRIQVNPGACLSLQKHSQRAEHWIVVKGIAKIIRGEDIFTLNINESTYIPIGQIHQLCNPGKDFLEIIEVQSGVYLGEDDIDRIDDGYGRALVR